MNTKDWVDLKITPIFLSPIDIKFISLNKIKNSVNKKVKTIKEDVIIFGKHSLATVVIIPIMFYGVIRSFILYENINND